MVQMIDFSKILSLYITKLHQEFSVTPIVGCELEFYTNMEHKLITKLTGLDVIREEGLLQAEIRFDYTYDLLALANRIKSTKKIITGASADSGLWTSFEAKPIADQPGSAMHIHMNFLHRGECEQGRMPKYLMHAIAGALHTLNDMMPLFAPTRNSYARFIEKSMTTPTTISWGRNNRTAALRLIANYNNVWRAEHRVPGADADVHAVLTAIIFGAYIGISMQMQPSAETHGLAFHEQYNLAPIMVDHDFNNSLISSCYAESYLAQMINYDKLTEKSFK
jgi:glutamine synthetase